ncbi:MAG: hypothetical protein LBM71_00175 [Elusimicrobiota bacterium]|jgi:tetratricopeptide (TPR) repeat protein|nr:hypothetical protein [Elusimicrobiota bacterium]
MKPVSYYENLLDSNKPMAVLKDLAKYSGKDGKIYFIIAEAKRLLGKFEDAINLYNKAIKLYQMAKKAEISAFLKDAAQLSTQKPLSAKAYATKEASKELAKEAAQAYAATAIDMRLALAKCYRTLGDAKKAYTIAKNALALAAKEGPALLDFKIQALQEMAMALRAYGKLDDAMDILSNVLAYYQAESDFAGQSFVYWAIGGICRLQGAFKAGVEHFKKAIALAKKGGDKMAEAYGYCGLAGISRIGGDIKGCVDNYLKAERIFRNSDDVFGKAYTNCGMANGLRQLGKYDEAMRRYLVADRLYTSINDTVDLGFVKWGKADVLKRKNKLGEALKELMEARRLFAASDEIRGQILTELALAQVLYALGDTEKAEKIYDDAVARAKKEGLHTYLEAYT